MFRGVRGGDLNWAATTMQRGEISWFCPPWFKSFKKKSGEFTDGNKALPVAAPRSLVQAETWETSSQIRRTAVRETGAYWLLVRESIQVHPRTSRHQGVPGGPRIGTPPYPKKKMPRDVRVSDGHWEQNSGMAIVPHLCRNNIYIYIYIYAGTIYMCMYKYIDVLRIILHTRLGKKTLI